MRSWGATSSATRVGKMKSKRLFEEPVLGGRASSRAPISKPELFSYPPLSPSPRPSPSGRESPDFLTRFAPLNLAKWSKTAILRNVLRYRVLRMSCFGGSWAGRTEANAGNCSPPVDQSQPVERCSLSLRERARVRGNRALNLMDTARNVFRCLGSRGRSLSRQPPTG